MSLQPGAAPQRQLSGYADLCQQHSRGLDMRYLLVQHWGSWYSGADRGLQCGRRYSDAEEVSAISSLVQQCRGGSAVWSLVQRCRDGSAVWSLVH